MKVSLITTVKNEFDNIEEFLHSVIKQLRKPDEFIIVDGGSIDGTVEIIKKYSQKYKWIKLIISKNATIGKGRNIAIRKAKNEIIAVTDAGCLLDKNWLKNITKPFSENRKIDVVVGVYKPYYTNDFEYFEGLIVVPQPEKIFMNPSRMSSRSIAFKKKCWKKVGGYPDLTTGEDTQFNIKLIKGGFNFYFAEDAIVYWRMRKNWKEFFKQFYRYGVGDRKSKNILKMKKNLLLVVGFWSYLVLQVASLFISLKVFMLLPTLPLLYFFINGLKLAIKSKKVTAILYGFLLTLIKRIAYVMGVSLENESFNGSQN
jgi:glycosyltransferase involved in cell wall biosynthesis